MAWKDELNNAKKVFNEGTPRQKLGFIWDYYKWYIVILLFVLGLVGSFIYTNVTAKEHVLGGIFLNSTSAEEVIELEQGFYKYSSVDINNEEVIFLTNLSYSNDTSSLAVSESYQTLQLISAKTGAGEIDFMVGDVTSMNNFAYWQYFCNLLDVLPEEKIEKYEPYFLYYDRAVVQELNDIDTTDNPYATVAYPDSKRPELMEDPVPIFIDVSECTKLQGIYPHMEDVHVIAFTVNGENSPNALAFLDYLLE